MKPNPTRPEIFEACVDSWLYIAGFGWSPTILTAHKFEHRLGNWGHFVSTRFISMPVSFLHESMKSDMDALSISFEFRVFCVVTGAVSALHFAHYLWQASSCWVTCLLASCIYLHISWPFLVCILVYLSLCFLFTSTTTSVFAHIPHHCITLTSPHTCRCASSLKQKQHQHVHVCALLLCILILMH